MLAQFLGLLVVVVVCAVVVAAAAVAVASSSSSSSSSSCLSSSCWSFSLQKGLGCVEFGCGVVWDPTLWFEG